MKKIDFQYLLFYKIHRSEILKNSMVRLENNPEIDKEQKEKLRQFISAFIAFLMIQMKNTKIEEDALHYWVQMHSNDMPITKSNTFQVIVFDSFKSVLSQLHHPYEEELLLFHNELLSKVTSLYLAWIEDPPNSIDIKQDYMKKLDAFSEILIQCNGTEDLPYLLTRTEEIFSFKRCIFLSYNPWLKEFSGAIGEELSKVQLMRGKIESEPVFSLKKPLFLKKPDPYVQQAAIELFNLSSIIFIPITFERQLYGWLTLDQQGDTFDCSKLQLDVLEQVGIRIGMYLARKQMGVGVKYPLDLTEKELGILHLLSEGYSNKEMAELMFLSEFTIRDYIQKLMIKLKAKNRTQIISRAFRMGLID
ncbi:LuxR C-terminal-related transcriptional regulator [Bacillus suaedaesalsae]|uniref:Response regulator transcription factor n=1 Tax=Bacillus suaedaesalsae TaxID=2810349 RepID=A0ABS2DH69_9BACI|nr:LuxR C-terminal-related transcriptional regulator [Bacillus suaedaesalsae]MBM6616901.1 response regulator transcription factor [Bacillus suaedaesalsae]